MKVVLLFIVILLPGLAISQKDVYGLIFNSIENESKDLRAEEILKNVRKKEGIAFNIFERNELRLLGNEPEIDAVTDKNSTSEVKTTDE